MIIIQLALKENYYLFSFGGRKKFFGLILPWHVSVILEKPTRQTKSERVR
jgi:hypothetical protein